MRFLPVSLSAAVALLGPVADLPVEEFRGPPGSSVPFLTATPSGGLLATWFEPRDSGRSALRIVERGRAGWSAPRTVAERSNFFVNWADFPSVTETADGKWIVHWLEKTAAKSYAYHVQTTVSADRGGRWSAPRAPHSDRSATEHGFVAMLPRPAGGADLIWLDGRQTADTGTDGSHGPMALIAGSLGSDGTVGPEQLLDGRVCDCCQTALARTSEGLIAVYRDRSAEEVRDISVVRQIAGRWSEPVRVAPDGWVYRACPVNGPSIATLEREVAVAWFTSGDGKPRVKLARSADAGRSFGPPVLIDDGNPLGRAEIELLPGGAALIAWLEITGDNAEWRLKRVARNGAIEARWTLGAAPRTRQAGFVRAALSGGSLFVAWTAPGPGGGVRVMRLDSPGK